MVREYQGGGVGGCWAETSRTGAGSSVMGLTELSHLRIQTPTPTVCRKLF